MVYTKKIKDKLSRNILFGILYISILGSIMHFLYDLIGKMVLIGIISPINESVWEHLKLSFYPTIIWWAISYMILGRKHDISFSKWFVISVISLVVSLLFIVTFYYTYTGAFGFNSTILDISSLYIGIVLGQLTALYVYRNKNLKTIHFIPEIFVFVALLIAFIYFTFIPPQFPLFKGK